MKKLSLFFLGMGLLYAGPCGARFGSGNAERFFKERGYHECRYVKIVNMDLHNGVIDVKVKNRSHSSKDGYVLAGYIDSASGRIGWACGYSGFDLDGREKDYIRVRLEAEPIFSRTYDAKVYCK